jgi:hypothetical protein
MIYVLHLFANDMVVRLSSNAAGLYNFGYIGI